MNYFQKWLQKYKLIIRVQNPFLKLFLFFFFFIFLSADSKAQSDFSKIADSLFITQNYTEAAKIYEDLFLRKDINHKNISIKLAYIYENSADYPKALYYLNYYYNQSPTDEVFDKMNKLALVNRYTGYERDNFNFFFAVYQQYYLYILYGIILLGIILMIFYFRRKVRHQPIFRNNIAVAVIYLIILGIFINLPSFYSTAIIKNKTYLRNFPTSAAPVVDEIDPGNKINIFGNREVWLKAYINKKMVYVNKDDLWILDN